MMLRKLETDAGRAALAAAIYVVCGAVMFSWVAAHTGPGIYLVYFPLLALLSVVHTRVLRRFRRRMDETTLEQENELRKLRRTALANTRPGTIRGVVFIAGGLFGDDLLGSATIEVQELQSDGQWGGLTSPGPAAAVVELLAEELKSMAMQHASDDTDD